VGNVKYHYHIIISQLSQTFSNHFNQQKCATMAAANPNLRTAAGPSIRLHRLHLAAGCLDEFCADEW
jgi:hypothetical protein